MLRLAQNDDFEKIFKIYMDPTVNPYMSWEFMNLTEFAPIFNELLGTGGLHVYEVNCDLACVLRIERKKYRLSHVAYIGGLGIRSQYQNQGLGLKIMEEAIHKLKISGVQRIELIVESDNPKAIRLYEKLGFVREGVLRSYFKRRNDDDYVNDYIMALLL